LHFAVAEHKLCVSLRWRCGWNMPSNGFFAERSGQSRVKADIVSKYFDAWAKVMIRTQNKQPDAEKLIGYMDFFAGPGRYDDGTPSTPLLVLEKAIQDEAMRERLITIFTDRNEDYANSLRTAISELPGIDTLKHTPGVYHAEVGDDIVKALEQSRRVPTLFFLDPWGFKGVSLKLISASIKTDWGCDCILFFNYNRVRMALPNVAVKKHMDALFGEQRAEALREQLAGLSSEDSELLIVETLCDAVKELGLPYALPFRFRDCHGTRASHHLIFVSKGFLGYHIMKDIMARESSSSQQGVPAFEYNPIDARLKHRQPLLFQLSRPLDELGDMLLRDFAGRTLTMREIYECHSVDRPYTSSNYKEVLRKLEEEGKITASKHRKGTFGDGVRATFPPSASPER